MSLEEQISLLVSGELPEAEAEALQQRIASDPAVAAVHAEMIALIVGLEALPSTAAPPALRSEVLPRAQTWRRVLPWMVAAAALLFALLSGGPASSEVILTSGTTVLDGQISLFAGDMKIALDGRAAISVEPLSPSVRVDPSDTLEDPMNTQTILAGMAGALITVTVYQGSALVMGDGVADTTVNAGEERSFGTPKRVVRSEPNTPERARELSDRAGVLAAELEETQRELAQEKFAGALTRGQLAAREGVPSEWPAGIPAPMTPENFRAELEAKVKDHPDFELSHVDCDEYPCVAALRYKGDDDSMEWGTPLADVVSAWTDEVLGDDARLSINQSRFKSDDSDDRFLLFGAHASEDGEAVENRMKVRVDDMIDGISSELKEEEEPAQP